MTPAPGFDTGNRDHRILAGRCQYRDIEDAVLLGADQLLAAAVRDRFEFRYVFWVSAAACAVALLMKSFTIRMFDPTPWGS